MFDVLKLGVLDLVPVLAGAEPAAALAEALRLARLADSNGYSRYWVAEHHDMPQLACTSPEVLLAHIGSHTQRIRLGSGALLLPHYKPLKVAESFHLLATLYPGRIDLGLGRAPGGSAHVAIALSGNFLEHVRQLPESLKDLTELLSGSYRMEGEPVLARPVPPIAPEVWMLGTNRKSAAYAAEFGTGYVFGQFMSDQDGEEAISAYRREFRPSPLTPKPRTMIAVGVVCAETEDKARELAAASRLFARSEEPEAGKSSADRKILAGTPEQVKKRLEELQHTYGNDEFLIVTMTANYETRLRSYELLSGAIG
ncbi:MsnO8 family LLM class oxidoreductase [Paenibacillus filicis]|uniref:MsnO8 family LLM class oxidoreductase n=1 Tax=Paenibacillus gyeongsangnamensis TaxID=3388067 RepID=A0ABT4QBC0_9BACL|nr:MsnO8 family LLM class oxidoreductase [Paenibacillus filicis]MCZ8514185.1 MsnO8 family LLM class oxidoreductase [Paenibacillus filicis]